MKIKLLDIQNDTVVPSEHCWLIPELKAVMEYYKDPIPALSYLYYMYDPSSAYINLPEDEREDVIINDFPGEYTTEDDVMITASNKIKLLYETPLVRFFRNSKIGLEKLGTYLASNEIEGGRDGNLNAFSMAFTRMAKTMQDFKSLEKMVEEENENIKIRGNKKDSWDI